MKVLRGNYAPIAPSYSDNLRQLIKSMLSVDPNSRPSAEQILKKPFLKKYILQVASEESANLNDYS